MKFKFKIGDKVRVVRYYDIDNLCWGYTKDQWNAGGNTPGDAMREKIVFTIVGFRDQYKEPGYELKPYGNWYYEGALDYATPPKQLIKTKSIVI